MAEVANTAGEANSIPLSEAAQATTGNQPSTLQIAFELLCMVVLPLLLPNLALAVAHDGLSLVDFSFGFIALSIAALTRAATVRTLAWVTIGVASFVLTTVFVSVAVSADQSPLVGQIASFASNGRSNVIAHAGKIAELGTAMAHTYPGPVQWISTIGLGLLLTGLTSYLIIKRVP